MSAPIQDDLISSNEKPDSTSYSEIVNEPEHLSENEMKLEELFNKWADLTRQEKYNCFKLFFKDFSFKFLPVTAVFLIYILTTFLNILFASHSKGPEKDDLLSGVGIGNILYNMVGVSVCFGMASALDTLCTQAYGARLYYLMGCYFNRARVILSIVFVPIFFFMCFTEQFFLLIGQKPEIAYHAGNYCRGMLPGLWFFYQTDAMRR